MTAFGDKLRKFRQASNDPERLSRRLSQERLGQLIGYEMGDYGYSGAAVSDWERGESIINPQDRNVLIAIIKVLHKCDGLRTLDDANQFLDAGNYSALNPDETKAVFPESIFETDSQSSYSETIETDHKSDVTGDFLREFSQTFQRIITKEKEGPSPYWPRVMVTIYRSISDRLSAYSVWTFILWVWVWILTWALIAPSLRWPFSNQDEALFAIVIYAGGAIVIPALIGVLTNTENNEFWQKQSVRELNLRLYTHQGASIGFHVGYFFIFMISLLSYNLGLQSVVWMELLAMTFPIFLSYASARLIPYNLLLAYKNLHLKNGDIFFVFFLFSPVWGYFLLQSYEILLTKSLGIVTVLIALTILVAMMTVRQRQSGTTIIPVSWWVIFLGSIVLCQLLVLLVQGVGQSIF